MTDEYIVLDPQHSNGAMRPELLASLISSRLCHDIVSPLGAIGNGLELLQMSRQFGAMTSSPELRLIAESVEAARVRIKWFRLAFGHAASDQRIGCAEISSLFNELRHSGRLSVRLDAEGDLPRTEARLMLLALMCLESAMPWGGAVQIARGASGWRLLAEAARMKQSPDLWAWLGSDAQDLETLKPGDAHFALLASHARAEGRKLRYEIDETGAEISF